MTRVRLIDGDTIPEHLRHHVEANRAAEAALFGGKAANINSAKLTAHIPQSIGMTSSSRWPPCSRTRKSSN